jgi:zinc protease
MKKQTLLISILLFLVVYNVAAQQLPLDDKVRYGKLPNGLTYYIRYNKLPEQRADFHIAQKVGSILEEDNQRGLAHFLEHMAFNGSKNYPGNTMNDYLEKVGIKFGENLNAYTSIDETVYRITNVPTTRQGILDSCLLVLHDWSNCLLLDGKEIDKERRVIHEEWRTRADAKSRMEETILPEIYGNDLYGHRLPIGLMDIVDNCSYQTLRDYYHKWYRPDLQGIIIVGDIDVDKMESKLKAMFADIPAPVNPAKRVYFPVTDNKEPIVTIASDKEATDISLLMFNKHDAFSDEAKGTAEYLMVSYIRNLCSDMINARFQEITQKPNPPFVSAEASDESFFVSKTKDAWTSYIECKQGKIEDALNILVKETLRAKKFGFTQSEYDRARADFMKGIENIYNERDKQKNNTYTREYIRHFLDGEASPGIDFEYNFYKKIGNQITLQHINEYMSSVISDENVVIALMMPQKDNLAIPSKADLLNAYNKAKSDTILPYKDKLVDTKLISRLPKAGKVKKKTVGPLGTTEWTLSNGIKVQFKQTEFKKDQILMKAVSLGGTSLLDEKDMPTIYLLNDLITLGGVGKYNTTDLTKALSGKKLSVEPSIGLRTEVINADCDPADFETMMQLIYLYFTQPREDKEAFNSYISRTKSALQNSEANPRVTFGDSIRSSIYGNRPRAKRITYDLIDKVDYQLAMKFYKQRFENADAFTFTFVGNINPDSVQQYIEQYLGALPKTKNRETFADIKMNPRKGNYSNIFDKKMETEQSSIYVYYSGVCDYKIENSIYMDALSQILDIVYTEKIREEKGGTYGVRVYGGLNKYPNPNFNFQISFDTNIKQKDTLIAIVYDELKNVVEKGPSEVNFNKVKEFMLKKIKENKAENGYWLGVIDEFNFTQMDKTSEYENIVNRLTVQDVQNFAKSILTQGNKIEVVMNPVVLK